MKRNAPTSGYQNNTSTYFKNYDNLKFGGSCHKENNNNVVIFSIIALTVLLKFYFSVTEGKNNELVVNFIKCTIFLVSLQKKKKISN